ncbi:uncharacterized protein (TIGR02301 family) [Pseudochelatococcus lubricantis]|uniref:Uncharacterized protein (TIGR02301 family) n=1 Tax=Pseudochelatococcus lubricantis TaxID=1538102 RepID=A0ABX0V5L0_9HYPH|nr:uncharacterized protein (TIGR02301 family) [Pseudochelatococcus lubricantis]
MSARGARRRFPRLLAVCLLAAASAHVSSAARAQRAPLPPVREAPPAESAPVQEPEAETIRTPPPGYENNLVRLSEVMGALSFLRALCGAPDAPEWHGRMAALIDSESRDAETRARLAGAFNQGYRGFSVTYRICTDAAQVSVARYLAEGERLSRAIAARFGG